MGRKGEVGYTNFKTLSKGNLFFKMYVFNLVISKMSAEIQPDALKKPQDVGLLILFYTFGSTLLSSRLDFVHSPHIKSVMIINSFRILYSDKMLIGRILFFFLYLWNCHC